MAKSRNLKGKAPRRKTKVRTISLVRPECMEIAKHIEIRTSEEEDDHEQNFNRRRQA